MKKLILASTFAVVSLGATNGYAQDAAQLKQISIDACDAQVAQIPEDQRELVLEICKCTVENTDYEALLAKAAAGDQSLQADAIAVAQKCQEEATQ